MFIDESGRFREDNGIPGRLDSTDTDYVIDIFFDQTVQPSRTRFQRYLQVGSGPTATLAPIGGPQDLENVGSIWNARDVLADMNQADLEVQRLINGVTGTYDEPAQNKRYIFSFLDNPGSGSWGSVDAGEVIDFVPANFNPGLSNNHRYLAINAGEAMNLVRYIRGQDCRDIAHGWWIFLAMPPIPQSTGFLVISCIHHPWL
jgi:hypothetical protein